MPYLAATLAAASFLLEPFLSSSRNASLISSSVGGAGGFAPSSITTYSPRGSVVCAYFTASCKVPRHISSCSLVSSRASTTLRIAPHAVSRSSSVFSRRCGASYNTTVRISVAISSICRLRSLPLRGKKPSKTNRAVGKPLITSAIVRADGPGIAETVMPAFSAALTSRSPGSLIPGVPASLTSATSVLSSNSATTRSHASCSVCSLMTMYFLPDRPRCCNNKPVRRVSSQQTTVTEPSVSMARCDMSLRLPIGVATSVSVPLMRCALQLSRQHVRQIVQSIRMAARQLFLIAGRVLQRALARGVQFLRPIQWHLGTAHLLRTSCRLYESICTAK